MRVIIRAVLTASVAAILAGSSIAPASAFTRLTEGQSHLRTDMTSTSNPAGTPAFAAASKLRIATFNTSLNREYAGALASDLSTPQNAQGRAVAEIVQRSAPDILLVNEFDYDAKGESAGYFRTNYLAVGQNGQDGIDYPYVYAAPSNTGVPSGADLDRDGTVGGPADALGYGDFEGQYGMVLYSRYPILTGQSARCRTSSGQTCLIRGSPQISTARSNARSCACRASRNGTSRCRSVTQSST